MPATTSFTAGFWTSGAGITNPGYGTMGIAISAPQSTNEQLTYTLLEQSQNRYRIRANRPADLRMDVLRVQPEDRVYTQKVLFP
ncbi:hypothetical protein [Spirosoma pulveris]